MFRRAEATVGALLLLAVAAAVTGETTEKTAETDSATPEATAPDIAQWVKDMDSDTFTVREQAVARLTQAGKAAVGPVAKAAKGDSLEVTTRAIKVLKNLMGATDAPAKAAAITALEKLAKDENHPAGHMAWQALQPRKGPGRGRGIGTGRIFIGGNVVVGNVVAVGPGRVRIAFTNVNGDKSIDVTENGKKIKITENKGGITVTVTDPPQGDKKPKPKQYKAANADELRKKHPEAHKLYEKYAKGRGAVIGNIQIAVAGQAVAGRAAAINAVPRRGRGRGARTVQMVKSAKLIDEARKQLDQAAAGIKAVLEAQAKRAVRKGDKLDLAKLLEQITAARKKLAEARKNLLQ